jgi:hypothetical protein
MTIMALELKPPSEHPTFGALLPLCPTALSYLFNPDGGNSWDVTGTGLPQCVT